MQKLTDEKKLIGIIGAMDQEVDGIISSLTDVSVKKICDISYYEGSHNNQRVVVAKCGIGKVFAAMCATAMILNFNVSKIIHIGIAGALDPELKTCDVVIATKLVQHDVDLTPFGMKPGHVQGLKDVYVTCDKQIIEDLEKAAKKINVAYKLGVIASGDQFVNNENSRNRIVENFNAIACEMEGASTGQICAVNNVPFAVVRSLSDNSNENTTDVYTDLKVAASDVSTRIIKEYLSL